LAFLPRPKNVISIKRKSNIKNPDINRGFVASKSGTTQQPKTVIPAKAGIQRGREKGCHPGSTEVTKK
jgi:hypothetical protein